MTPEQLICVVNGQLMVVPLFLLHLLLSSNACWVNIIAVPLTRDTDVCVSPRHVDVIFSYCSLAACSTQEWGSEKYTHTVHIKHAHTVAYTHKHSGMFADFVHTIWTPRIVYQ